MQMRRVWTVGLLVAVMVSLTGCAGFFVYPGTATGTGSGSSTVTNYAYVSNSSSGSTLINGYSLASGNLTTPTTGSPYSLGYIPIAMSVTPANTFLYVAVDASLASGSVTGGMYVYAIGTGGALTLANGNSAVASGDYSAIDISPDGQWLFALDTTGLVLYEYQINATTGALTQGNTLTISPGNTNPVAPVAVKVAPSADFVVATLGTAGDVIYSFNTSTGALGGTGGTTSTIGTGSAAVGDYGVTIDANNDIYLARTTGVAVYTATSVGSPTAVNVYTAGNGPHSIVVTGTSGHVYTGNQTDSTISGFSVGSGAVLTALTGTTGAPLAVGVLKLDKSGTYVLAGGYNASNGLELYTIGTTGVLTAASTAATGTSTAIPMVIAMSH